MEQQTNGVNSGKSTSDLEQKLSTYRELQQRFEQLREQLHRADDQKGTVRTHIFDKVKSEYNRELDSVRAQMTPLKKELDEFRVEIERDLETATAAVLAVEDQVAETDFRHRVGEFTAEQRSQVVQELEAELTSKGTLKRDLEDMLAAFVGSVFPPAGNNGNPPPTPPAELRDEAAPEFVNPKTWFDTPPADDNPVEEQSAVTAQPDAAAPVAADPATDLAGLADPSNEGLPQGNHQGQFPNLVIRTGSHEGKTIPLLPMTMSIGREHDNNIELKDPDVSRYHARIRYDGGKFHIEDLDSSTGTLVNGVRIASSPLTDGDVVRIGGTEIAVEVAARPPVSA